MRLRTLPVLLAAGVALPVGSSLAATGTAGSAATRDQGPSGSLRRQLDEAQIGLRDATDRIVALEGLRRRDAEALHALRRELEREQAARAEIEEQLALEARQLRKESEAALIVESAAIRSEMKGQDEAIRNELQAYAAEESGLRILGDRRSAWALGGATLSLLLLGVLWWWTRNETRVIRVRIRRIRAHEMRGQHVPLV